MASPVIDVYIKLPSGRTTSLNLLPEDNVSKIYTHVASEERVDVGQVQIKYTGKILKKQHTVGYLGVCKETILKAEIFQKKKINIIIQKPDGKSIPLTIHNTSSIQEIKNQIEVKEGVEPHKQTLKLGRAALTDGTKTAIEESIRDEAVLVLHINTSHDTSHDTKENGTKEDEEVEEEKKEEILGSFDAAGRNVEVVFSFDTTGSMYGCLEEVRTRLKGTVTRLLRDIPRLRVGVVAHGDYCDQSTYVLKHVDLTSDVETLVNFVDSVPKTGGGDSPECYEWVLRKAQMLDWSEDSAKALVVIGDCEPHPPSYTDQNIFWKDEVDVLKGMGVKVYGCKAQHKSAASLFYEEISERTGGVFLTLKQFGLITDMFLAVCYKESSPEQLQAFSSEIEQEGRMTEEVKEMFTQLEDTQTEEVEERKMDEAHNRFKPQRYLSEGWWDPSLDHGMCQYYYDSGSDSWEINPPGGKKDRSENIAKTHPPTAGTSISSKPKKGWSFRKRNKMSRSRSAVGNDKKCCIM